VRYWEIIADNLSKAGWSWGCVSAVDFRGRTIWIADAHRDDGKRYVVHADEKLTAFVELEADSHGALRGLHDSRTGEGLEVKQILQAALGFTEERLADRRCQ